MYITTPADVRGGGRLRDEPKECLHWRLCNNEKICFFPIGVMGLCLAALWAAGAPLLLNSLDGAIHVNSNVGRKSKVDIFVLAGFERFW